METTGDALERLERSWSVLLTTYKRDGSPVGTPVSLAADDGCAYFRTYDKSWKSRRLGRDPRVEMAPAGLRGKATGPSVSGRARLLEGDEARRAGTLLAHRHPILQGAMVPLAHKLARYQTLHYEVSLDADGGGEGAAAGT